MQRVLSSRVPLGYRLWLLVVELSWALMDQGFFVEFHAHWGVPVVGRHWIGCVASWPARGNLLASSLHRGSRCQRSCFTVASYRRFHVAGLARSMQLATAVRSHTATEATRFRWASMAKRAKVHKATANSCLARRKTRGCSQSTASMTCDGSEGTRAPALPLARRPCAGRSFLAGAFAVAAKEGALQAVYRSCLLLPAFVPSPRPCSSTDY